MKNAMVVVALTVLMAAPGASPEEWAVELKMNRKTQIYFVAPARTTVVEVKLVPGQLQHEVVISLFIKGSQFLMQEGAHKTGVASFEFDGRESRATLKLMGWDEDVPLHPRFQIMTFVDMVRGIVGGMAAVVMQEADQCRCLVRSRIQRLYLNAETGRNEFSYEYGAVPQSFRPPRSPM